MNQSSIKNKYANETTRIVTVNSPFLYFRPKLNGYVYTILTNAVLSRIYVKFSSTGDLKFRLTT
jgi:hypothetical protein